MSLSYEALVADMVAKGIPDSKARLTALNYITPQERSELLRQAMANDTRSEKAIEHAGDRLMAAHGFEVIRFSHPGKTRQTPGIADRLYIRRPRPMALGGSPSHSPPVLKGLAVWVEFKAVGGKQRPGQKLFQELVESVGQNYVIGGLDELRAWLAERGLT